ncbi:MAG: hypothetical protein ACUVQ8_07070 [Nitrososphaeria archaeon]
MNLDSVVAGCKENIPKYWDDSYLQKNRTRLLKVAFEDKKNVYLITEETIFHPKYGGQPSDRGVVFGKGFIVNVVRAIRHKGHIILYGKMKEGVPETGVVFEEIDWSSRYLMMKRHTASHLFDHALKITLGSNVETLDSWLGEGWYVTFKGSLPSEEKLRATITLENKFIREGYTVHTRLIDRSRLLEEAKGSPNLARLPELEVYRLVRIGEFEEIACSGTHLRNTLEIREVLYVRSEGLTEGFKVYLDLA